MRLSDSGLTLLKSLESCGLAPYKDSKGVWTDGYGNTHNVIPGVSISQDEADTMLLDNVIDTEQAISRLIKVDLTQNQFDALVIFAFNIGVTAFKNSTLLLMLNAGHYTDASEQFSVWDKCAGKTLLGLVRRRETEKELFLTA